MKFKDENNNGIDDDFEKRLLRDLFITQVIAIIALIGVAILVGHLFG